MFEVKSIWCFVFWRKFLGEAFAVLRFLLNASFFLWRAALSKFFIGVETRKFVISWCYLRKGIEKYFGQLS